MAVEVAMAADLAVERVVTEGLLEATAGVTAKASLAAGVTVKASLAAAMVPAVLVALV